jgi:hypothetical protein
MTSELSSERSRLRSQVTCKISSDRFIVVFKLIVGKVARDIFDNNFDTFEVEPFSIGKVQNNYYKTSSFVDCINILF